MSESGKKCQRTNLAKKIHTEMLHATMMLYDSDYKIYNAPVIPAAHAAAAFFEAAVVLACRAVLFMIHLSLQTAALILKNMSPCDLATGCHSRVATGPTTDYR